MTPAQTGLIDAMGRAAPGYAGRHSFYFAEIARRLVELSPPPRRGSVLDVATGPGVVLSELGDTDCTLVGIDLSEEMLSEARQRLGSAAELLCMDAERLEFDDETFDSAFCSCALYQLPSPERAIAEVRRVLKPNGAFAVSVFGAADERWLAKDELYATAPPLPRVGRRFDAESLRDALSRFAAVEVMAERLDVTYADAEEWLAGAWTHGERRVLDAMDATGLEAFRASLPAALEPAREGDGLLHWRPEVVYAVSRA